MKGKLGAVVPLAGGLAALKVYDALRKPKPLGVHYLDAPTKALVVGGGFGGITAVEKLVHALDGSREVGVVLLDRVNFHLLPDGTEGRLIERRDRSPGTLYPEHRHTLGGGIQPDGG